MKSIKFKNKKENLVKIIFLFIILILNIKEINCSENRYKENILSEDFEKAFFGNSISYEEYDSFSYQLNNFFGIDLYSSKTSNNYEDLKMANDSKKLRDLYESKINQMILNKKTGYENFYNKKL